MSQTQNPALPTKLYEATDEVQEPGCMELSGMLGNKMVSGDQNMAYLEAVFEFQKLKKMGLCSAVNSFL